MSFIKKLSGKESKNESNCCGVEIKEIDNKEEVSCCGSSNEKDDSCC
jgi:hypothetical protein